MIFGRLPLHGMPPADPARRGAHGAEDAPGSNLRAPSICAKHGVTLGVTGRPRIDDRGGADGLAERILEAYLAHGPSFLSHLRGPFALFAVDTQRGRTLLAIDRMGIESLAWGSNGTTLSFGTSAAEVAAALTASPSLNTQALFDFMLGHVVSAPDSVYAGVSKLPAATYLVNDGGRIRLERYWHPRFDRPATQDMDALSREVVAALGRAVVASDIEPAERTGSFLSGGLDSSTVTGLLAVSARQASPAFSVGFGVEEFNELAYARIASQRFHCPHFEYQVTAGDVVEIVPRIAAAYDEPFGNSSALPTFCCARLAKEHGVDHLLAGDGGDELFGGNERYVRQKVFEHYTRLPGWSRKFLLQPLADRLDPETSPFPLRKLSSYVRQARVPLPERYESWNMIYREGSAEVFDPDLVATVDTSYHLRKMREAWDECPSDDLLDRMLWYDWKFTLADNDLRKVTRMCELAGVRVSFPMLDEDVVDLSLRVPSHAKIEGNDLRSFFKKAVRELLPREIIDKKKHGFGLPFGVWLKEHGPLQELVYDSLNALKSRHLLNRNFIERVASEHRQGHASYYGYAIWDLMMLEQWFQQRAPGLGERAKPERTAPGAPRQASTNGAPPPS